MTGFIQKQAVGPFSQFLPFRIDQSDWISTPIAVWTKYPSENRSDRCLRSLPCPTISIDNSHWGNFSSETEWRLSQLQHDSCGYLCLVSDSRAAFKVFQCTSHGEWILSTTHCWASPWLSFIAYLWNSWSPSWWRVSDISAVLLILHCHVLLSRFSESSYLMRCTIENHLSEDIVFGDRTVEPARSSIVLLKQSKISLTAFPLALPQLITAIRTQLPTHIYYRTRVSVSKINVCDSDDSRLFDSE